MVRFYFIVCIGWISFLFFVLQSDPAVEQSYNNDDEQQYLDHIKKILEKGHKKMDRTRVGTLSLFGIQMRYNLMDGNKY